MMLFFRKLKIIKNKRHPHMEFAPLQVRIQKENPGKRALSWAALLPEAEKEKGRAGLRGSLTFEAALCLPLFLFFCFCLLMPMRMMERQRQMQAAVESVGEDLSRYAYIAYCMEEKNKKRTDISRVEDGEGFSGDVLEMLSEAYAAAAVSRKIDNSWVEQVNFLGTDIGTDDMVRIQMNCRMRLPFSVLGIHSIPVEILCSRRMWTGAEDNRWKKEAAGDEAEDEMVYVGKASTRYHRLRTCHYLWNDLETVSEGQLESLRNQDGKCYHPCSVCGKKGSGGLLYVMPYGTSYHRDAGCSAINAYVQTAPLKSVEHLGECSYCGRR